MIVKQLEKLVQSAVRSLKAKGLLNEIKDSFILFEHPENPEHGDYSTNIALVLGQQLKDNPHKVAEEIRSHILNTKYKILNTSIAKIEVAGPGFINFFLKQEYLIKELQEVVKQKEKYGLGTEKKKVMVEFTDPNPFKEFHIGHLYSNAVGESLSRLFEAMGAQVKRANYQGDVGLHIAKAILGMKLRPETIPNEKDPLSKKAQWLGGCYALGSGGPFESGGSLEQFNKLVEQRNQWVEDGELERINTIVYEQSNTATQLFAESEIKHLYKLGRKWSLKAFEQIYKRLGTKFDYYYFESEVASLGMKTVEAGLKKGIFKKSQSAIIFPGEQYGLHSRVFINSQGLPTYEAKDLGLAFIKYKDFPFDVSLSITGNEQKDYFQVVFAALKEVNPKLGEKMQHISHGMVRLPEGKMSSRTGNVVIAEWLIEEVKNRVVSIMKSSRTEVPNKEQASAAEIIAVGAIKYALLRVSVGKDIIFDLEKSLSLQGDSGPYLQYTYARCKSILHKAKSLTKSSYSHLDSVKFSPEELALLRLLYRFPEVARDAAERFSPNLVCSFVFNIAQAYNNFYNTHRVLQAEDKETKQFRLLLTAATAQIIQNSLHLLGVKTLDRM